MSDTVCTSGPLPGTAGAAVDIVLCESAGNPLQPDAPDEATRYPTEADAPLKITGEQTIRNVGELQTTLAGYAARGLAMVVDLSEVQECDTAALQLICALRQSAILSKQSFRITGVSPAIAETAAALGVRIEGMVTAGGAEAEDVPSEARA